MKELGEILFVIYLAFGIWALSFNEPIRFPTEQIHEKSTP